MILAQRWEEKKKKMGKKRWGSILIIQGKKSLIKKKNNSSINLQHHQLHAHLSTKRMLLSTSSIISQKFNL